MNLRKCLTVLIIYALLVVQLTVSQTTVMANEPSKTGVEVNRPQNETQEGLRFRLSEGEEQPEKPATRPPVAPAQILNEAETTRLLQRLPAMRTDPDDETDFAMRERSLPPPRAGKTITVAFPARAEAAPEETGRPYPSKSFASRPRAKFLSPRV